jgi:hypothetical protein
LLLVFEIPQTRVSTLIRRCQCEIGKHSDFRNGNKVFDLEQFSGEALPASQGLVMRCGRNSSRNYSGKIPEHEFVGPSPPSPLDVEPLIKLRGRAWANVPLAGFH